MVTNSFYTKLGFYELDSYMYPIDLFTKKSNKFLNLSYEINGKQYEEKLLRVEQKLPWIMKF